MKENKALVLGANYYIGLSAIRCLGRKGVWVTAADYDKKRAYAFRSRYCREQLLLPHYDDTENFVSALMDFGQQQKTKPLLIPTADAYAQVVDSHAAQLGKHFLLTNPRPSYYSDIIDKSRLHKLAADHNVAVPETLPSSMADRAQEVLGFPCLVKPLDSPHMVSAFRVKMFEVDNQQQLEEVLQRCNHHNIEVLLQRIIPGPDHHMHTYDAYVDQKGKVTHWLTCRKLRQYPINYGASVFTRQQYVPRLHDIGGHFLEAIGYKGFAEIEFKYDSQRDTYYLIEINVRLSNLNVMLDRAGLNFPWITYRDMLGDPLPSRAITRDTGLHFWFFREDMAAIRDYLKAGQMKLSQALASLFVKKVYAVWQWSDPLPGLAYALRRTRRRWRKILRRD